MENDSILFDLETNQKLEGNYFICPSILVNIINTLMQSGYKINDVQLKDVNTLYLKDYGVNVSINQGQDINKLIEMILSEGKTKGEYRRISYTGLDSIKYDSFTPSNIIKIEFSKKYIELDSLMVPIISVLREKGYVTRGCCSGHHDKIYVQDTGLMPNEDDPYFLKNIITWIVFSIKDPVPVPPQGADSSTFSDFYRIS